MTATVLATGLSRLVHTLKHFKLPFCFHHDEIFLCRAPYNIPNKKGLLRLLRTHDLKGWGGILLDDIQESLPKSEKVIRVLTEEDKIVVISRGADKKKVVFYKDHEDDFEIDEEFQKLWRSVPVDGVDERKIDEYLDKQGIKSMQDQVRSDSVNRVKLDNFSRFSLQSQTKRTSSCQQLFFCRVLARLSRNLCAESPHAGSQLSPRTTSISKMSSRTMREDSRRIRAKNDGIQHHIYIFTTLRKIIEVRSIVIHPLPHS